MFLTFLCYNKYTRKNYCSFLSILLTQFVVFYFFILREQVKFLNKSVMFFFVHDFNGKNQTVCLFITETFTVNSTYRADYICWLHKYSLYFGFLLPVGIMLFTNIIFFVIISKKVVWKKKKVSALRILSFKHCIVLV